MPVLALSVEVEQDPDLKLRPDAGTAVIPLPSLLIAWQQGATRSNPVHLLHCSLLHDKSSQHLTVFKQPLPRVGGEEYSR